MRFLVNLAVAAGLTYLFIRIGWIALPEDADLLVICAISAILFSIITYIWGLVFGLSVLFTCGIGCFLLPLFWILQGTTLLWVMSQAFPEILINGEPIIVIIMSLIYSLIRWNNWENFLSSVSNLAMIIPEATKKK